MSVKSLRNQLLAAIAMVLVAALSLGSSTFAWFTMNTEVEAVNMQVTARAEAGLLINEVSTKGGDYWDNSATANAQPGTALVPTSTTNGNKWFHANSKKANDAAAGTATNTANTAVLSGIYEEVSANTKWKKYSTNASAGTQAGNEIAYISVDDNATYDNAKENAYYVMYKYYLRVSNNTGLSGLGTDADKQNVAIKEVKATKADSGSAVSADLDKALRVGVVIGGKMYIYAPYYGGSNTSAQYYAVTSITNTGDPVTQTIESSGVIPYASNKMVYTALTAVPGVPADNGEEVDIYIWYEGEDANCISNNITETIDNLKIDVTFALVTLDSAAATAAAAQGTTNDFSTT